MRIPLIILTLTRLTYLNSRCVLRVAFCFIVYARAIFAYTSHTFILRRGAASANGNGLYTWISSTCVAVSERSERRYVHQWRWIVYLDKFGPPSNPSPKGEADRCEGSPPRPDGLPKKERSPRRETFRLDDVEIDDRRWIATAVFREAGVRCPLHAYAVWSSGNELRSKIIDG